jgi:hypothetical protein
MDALDSVYSDPVFARLVGETIARVSVYQLDLPRSDKAFVVETKSGGRSVWMPKALTRPREVELVIGFENRGQLVISTGLADAPNNFAVTTDLISAEVPVAERLAHFARVTVADGVGIVENEALVLSNDFHAARKPLTFTVCDIDGQRIAVFLDRPDDAAQRLQVCERKPEWLDALVFANLHPCRAGEPPVISITPESICGPRRTTCAFAAAVAVHSHGLVEAEPPAHIIRFGSSEVTVKLAFDWDSESWHGTADVLLASNLIVPTVELEARMDAIVAATEDAMKSVIHTEPSAREALRYYVLFSDVACVARAGLELTELQVFYNQYFWFKHFLALHGRTHPIDAGLQQAEMKIFENAPEHVDWDVVKSL